MSFLSFLSSHRLHASHRPWIDPLPMQLDILLHEIPHDNSDLLDLSVTPAADLETKPKGGAADGPPVMEAA